MICYQLAKTTQTVAYCASAQITGRRYLWQYVCQAFNRVDAHRLKEVGPDRMCAEWILKNGGAVRFTDNPTILHKNYNTLPPENNKIKISEIDATTATIMSIGFEHLKNCQHIKKIILDNCKYLEDEAVSKLSYVDKSLDELQINRCRNISQAGLLELVSSVPHLKRLQVGRDMPLLKDIESSVIPELKKHLPQCEITIKD